MLGKRNYEQAKPLLAALGDLLIITGSRENQRACFPPAFFACATKLNTTLNVYEPEDWLYNIDFSGEGAWYFYKEMLNYTFTLNSNLSIELLQEYVFHSIWETWNEDLPIL